MGSGPVASGWEGHGGLTCQQASSCGYPAESAVSVLARGGFWASVVPGRVEGPGLCGGMSGGTAE